MKFTFKFILYLFFLIFAYVYYLFISLPNPNFLSQYSPSSIQYIYDDKKNLIEEIGEEYHSSISYPNIPNIVIQAFLHAEDRYFFSHFGIDCLSIVRSIFYNIKYKKNMGGSTITQQLAKNFLIGDDKTLIRKLKEAVLSFKLEYFFSKPKILEMYLNHIYMGHKVFGIYEATKKYFNKDLLDIAPGEACFLAALTKYPSNKNKENILKRRNYILKSLLDHGIISNKQYQNSIKLGFPTVLKKKKANYAHYFVEEVKKEIKNSNSQKIFTSLNPKIQKIVEKNLYKYIKKYQKTISTSVSGGVVVMNARNGEVIAETGGVDYNKQIFDYATQAKRQIGSLFKPFIYLGALEKKMSMDLVLKDQPLQFDNGYKPKNFSGRFYGSVSLKNAFIYSYNLIALQLAQKVGMKKIRKINRKFNVFDTFKSEWSSVLGACETTLLKICSAYSTFVNGGLKISPTFLKNKNPIEKQIITYENAEQIKSLLEDVVKKGTAKKLSIFQKIWDVGGKTGTTNQCKDAWYVGYIKSGENIYVIGVFIGATPPKSLGKKETGSTLTTPIVYSILKDIYSQYGTNLSF